MLPDQRVLGIDPGFGRVGFGAIRVGRAIEVLRYGCIETKGEQTQADRLLHIAEELRSLLQELRPTVVAIEKLFFAKNVTTALGVSEARGVILLIAAEAGCRIVEFTPIEVKLAVTGYGQADKEQVGRLVQRLLKLPEPIASDDASDALAIAICSAQTISFPTL
jgi:crossover junction endodeoxyribonuclease RuvC